MLRGVLAAAAALIVLAACGGSTMQITAARVPMAAGAQISFDDIEIDQASHTIYVADRANSGVDVFDVSNAQPVFVKTIQLPAPANGLAIDAAHNHVYAGTASGSVEVIDTVLGTAVAEIKTPAKDVDLLDYAPGPNLLFASTGLGGTLLTIDAATNKIIATANVGAPLEQPRYDPSSGNVYVTVPDRADLTVIDPKNGTLKGTVKLTACIPVGMAIRGTTAVIACHSGVQAYDLRSGKSNDLGGVQDGDVVQYFPDIDRFFVTSPHTGIPTIVGMFGGDPVTFKGTQNIDGGGNAAVYDERNDMVYTTDPRTKTAGLTGFHMDGTRPAPILQTALIAIVPLLALMLLVLPLWWFLGRHADPIHRPLPEEPKGPADSEPRPKPRTKLTA